MPLPNIGGDGSLCFGSNAAPVASGPTILHALHLFLASPFTGHWATEKSLAAPGDIRLRLLEIAEQEEGMFPEDELKPLTTTDEHGRHLTLDALLHHVLRR